MSTPAGEKIIECVPNFSEGRDEGVIRAIVDAISAADGVKVLHVDRGESANRTVVTFAGDPEAVTEAAFRGIKTAAGLIDMRRHSGSHPRIGATDVCPFVPIAGITIQETAYYSRKLAERVGGELKIPVYLYEESALLKPRKNLSRIRSGEYEGLADKIRQPGWAPDFGPAEFNERSGATVIGARHFLVAYNVNLDTKDADIAKAIAEEVRESGAIRGYDGNGDIVYVRGELKAVKAIGWYIEEYGRAQVSMNLTDIEVTPMHTAFESVAARAREKGVKATGSELIGLVPEKALLEAGRHYLGKADAGKQELIGAAVRGMGLDELRPFNAEERVVEYVMEGMKFKVES